MGVLTIRPAVALAWLSGGRVGFLLGWRANQTRIYEKGLEGTLNQSEDPSGTQGFY